MLPQARNDCILHTRRWGSSWPSSKLNEDNIRLACFPELDITLVQQHVVLGHTETVNLNLIMLNQKDLCICCNTQCMPLPVAQQSRSHDEYIYDPTNTFTALLENPTLDHLKLPIIVHASTGKNMHR